MDDGEPTTCIRRGQLLTTWRNSTGHWVVHIESVKQHAPNAVQAEKIMPGGNGRLEAYEFGRDWIDRVVRRSL